MTVLFLQGSGKYSGINRCECTLVAPVIHGLYFQINPGSRKGEKGGPDKGEMGRTGIHKSVHPVREISEKDIIMAEVELMIILPTHIDGIALEFCIRYLCGYCRWKGQHFGHEKFGDYPVA